MRYSLTGCILFPVIPVHVLMGILAVTVRHRLMSVKAHPVRTVEPAKMPCPALPVAVDLALMVRNKYQLTEPLFLLP